MEIINTFNQITIPDFWQLLLSVALAIGLVYLVEWLKQPEATIELAPHLNHPDGRKFLKVRVKVIKGSGLRKLFPWKNVAAFARLKGSLIEEVRNKEVSIFDFIAKWDTRPEPWDYNANPPRPKLELIPFSLEPENLLSGDVAEVSIAVKHPKEKHFYIFDPNYYINAQKNIVDRKLIALRLTLSSSSINRQKDFVILNEGEDTERFQLKELTK